MISLLACSVLLTSFANSPLKGDVRDFQRYKTSTLELVAEKEEVPYGQPVNVSWKSSSRPAVRSLGNLPMKIGDRSGRLVDFPATDTTYRVGTGTPTAEDLICSITVRVTRSNARILVVGDTSSPGTVQIAESFSKITDQKASTSLTIPVATEAELIVVLDSLVVGEHDMASIETHLSKGIGMVFVGESFERLSDKLANKSGKLSSILAGATKASRIVTPRMSEARTHDVPFSCTLFNSALVPMVGLRPVASSAARFEDSSDNSWLVAFMYTNSNGHRIGYVGAAAYGSSKREIASNELFLAVCRGVLGK